MDRETYRKKKALRARILAVTAATTLSFVCATLLAYGGLTMIEGRADYSGAGPLPGEETGREPADNRKQEGTEGPSKRADATDPTGAGSATPVDDPSSTLPPAGPDTAASEPVDTAPTEYVFGTPLGESALVDDSFFDTAVFLGDSRTEGLQAYSGLTHGDFLWHRGMSVFRADNEKYRVISIGGENLTMTEALARKQYDSVYLMLGINELGYPEASYEKALSALVDRIIELQPHAVVYLQTMMPVNDAKARENGLASYINNENVNAFNGAIVRVASEKRVVLLDTAEPYLGGDGQLPAELTSDGVHFTLNGYGKWADFLRGHVMDRDTYFMLREADGSEVK